MEGLGTTVDDINPALPWGPETMGIMTYSLLWVMQDIYHQPYQPKDENSKQLLVLYHEGNALLADLNGVLQEFCQGYYTG